MTTRKLYPSNVSDDEWTLVAYESVRMRPLEVLRYE
jgi:hypothetical protein